MSSTSSPAFSISTITSARLGIQPPGNTYLRMKKSVSKRPDRKSTRLNSSHSQISYAVFCLKKDNLLFPIGARDMPEVVAVVTSASGFAPAASRFPVATDLLIGTGSLRRPVGAILAVIVRARLDRKRRDSREGARRPWIARKPASPHDGPKRSCQRRGARRRVGPPGRQGPDRGVESAGARAAGARKGCGVRRRRERAVPPA